MWMTHLYHKVEDVGQEGRTPARGLFNADVVGWSVMSTIRLAVERTSLVDPCNSLEVLLSLTVLEQLVNEGVC